MKSVYVFLKNVYVFLKNVYVFEKCIRFICILYAFYMHFVCIFGSCHKFTNFEKLVRKIE